MPSGDAGMMEQQFPVWLGFLFPIFFVAMWISIARVISWMGWSAFAARFAFDRPIPPDATRYGSQSMSIGDTLFTVANYSSCVNVWIDRHGFYLRPQLLFRFFHPLLHIRWSQIERVEVRKGFFNRRARLTFRADLPVLAIGGRSGRAIAESWSSQGGRKAA